MKIAEIRYTHNSNAFGAKLPSKNEKLQTVTSHLWEHLCETVHFAPEHDVLYSGRKTEYEMEKFLDELLPPVVRNKKLSEADLDKLASYKILKIEGTQNSFRGPKGYSDIKLLKPRNLELVDADKLSNHFMYKEPSEFADDLVEFIRTMQKDNVFVGCNFGMNQTDFTLSLNELFNPMCKYKGRYNLTCAADVDICIDICDALKPEQKKAMGWTENFEKELREKLIKEQEYYINY